ncbi:hypothetical protein ONZ45_g8251 [Pleurotus djamor]|nr:hypothetical protein ONZ45_g8251 [Pleurotus djamor]
MLRSSSRFLSTAHRAQPSRRLKFARRLGYVALGTGAAWAVDDQFNASAITRNLRTFWTCAMITLDYKLNFTPEKTDQIPDLHERVANRLYDLLTSNGGLYIKIGQAIGANAAVLPKPIQAKFAKLFDDAPQVPYSTILSVFRSEFGRPPDGPDGVFEIFEEKAVASASIAQVHKAKLWNEDAWVAVKIQKPDVRKQMEWDLGAYKIVMRMYDYFFELPTYFVVDFISEHLRRELDFIQEAANAQETAEFVASEPRLSQNVHVPKVYPELTTKRIMTAEWIDGVRLSDKAAVRQLMGEGDEPRTPGAVTPKGGVNAVMQIMVELFSAQIFDWGWVHCDPHPGNVIIRPHPSNPSRPQLVLLDHGLYVRLPDPFRRQYADLWRGLLAADLSTVRRVAEQWGIGAPDLFASATLLQPVKFKDSEPGMGLGANFSQLSQYEQSAIMKEKLKGFLTDTDMIPKELIFLGRNMRIVQGNNQAFGSPVNRIRITGYWASRSLTTMPHTSFVDRLRESWHHVIFRSIMLTLDLWFYSSKISQWVRKRLGLAWEHKGFEDELEKAMRDSAKANFGIDVPPDVFEG